MRGGSQRALAVAIVAGALAVSPASAEALVSCASDSGQVRVGMSADNDSALIKRVGAEIVVVGGFIYPPFEQTRIGCTGSPPTVSNTDSVVVVQADNTEDQQFALDLRGGPFGPGPSVEADGSPEIEISLDLADDSDVYVEGTPGPDSLAASVADPEHFAIDLNAVGLAESGEPDVKLTPVKDVFLLGEEGADVVNAAAIPKIVSPHVAAVLTLGGGRGSDQLIAGGLQSIVSGGRDRDLLIGSKGPDVLDGGPGSDRIVGGKGKDSVFSVDGKRDTVGCGASRDHASADRRDKVKRCESITREGGHQPPDFPEPSFPGD